MMKYSKIEQMVHEMFLHWRQSYSLDRFDERAVKNVPPRASVLLSVHRLMSHSILLPNFKFKRWKLLSQRMRTSRMNGIGVDSQVQMKSGCEKMFLPPLKTSAFFSTDVIRWYYVIDHTSIKVRKYQLQIILFSHPPKNERNKQ